MAFDHKDQTSDYGSAISADPVMPSKLGRVVIGNPPDINVEPYKQPPPRAHISITIRPISNGWILTSLYSDRPIDFEGDRYYSDIGTLLADLESRIIEAGFGESGDDS